MFIPDIRLSKNGFKTLAELNWMQFLLKKTRCKASVWTDQIIDFWYVVKMMDNFFSLNLSNGVLHISSQ